MGRAPWISDTLGMPPGTSKSVEALIASMAVRQGTADKSHCPHGTPPKMLFGSISDELRGAVDPIKADPA